TMEKRGLRQAQAERNLAPFVLSLSKDERNLAPFVLSLSKDERQFRQIAWNSHQSSVRPRSRALCCRIWRTAAARSEVPGLTIGETGLAGPGRRSAARSSERLSQRLIRPRSDRAEHSIS